MQNRQLNFRYIACIKYSTHESHYQAFRTLQHDDIYLLVNTVIYAFGSLTSSTEKRQANNCDLPVTLTGNLFATNTLHSKTIYKSQVIAAANSINDTSLKSKPLKVKLRAQDLFFGSATHHSPA
jgi:hypothetical protein